MIDYRKISDMDINILVDASMGLGCTGKDYCNNPAVAWPIIYDNGISLYHDDGNWQAEITYEAPAGAYGTDETCSKFVDDKNPLRAAMIVFLMIRASE